MTVLAFGCHANAFHVGVAKSMPLAFTAQAPLANVSADGNRRRAGAANEKNVEVIAAVVKLAPVVLPLQLVHAMTRRVEGNVEGRIPSRTAAGNPGRSDGDLGETH